MKQKTNKLISTIFNLGFLPFPGILGSLAAIPLILLFKDYLNITFLIFFTLGVYTSNTTSVSLKKTDPSFIIVDELVGFMFPFLFLPINLVNFILVFILFRIFDNLKPWPIKIIEKKLKGGWGIMVDDVLAGIYALLITLLILQLKNFL